MNTCLAGSRASIDQLLFGETLSKLPAHLPGRPAFLTALNFLFLGLALLLLDLKSRYHSRTVELLTATAILISLLALIGYACNVPSFYTWTSLFPNAGMALHTAVAFTLLGAGILCARPDQGLMGIVTSPTASGTMARRLILAPVLIPLMTGLLKGVGLGTGMHNAEVASWLFAFLNLFIFTLAIWWSASLIHRVEIVRGSAEADLQKANTELERRVSERTSELSRAREGRRQAHIAGCLFQLGVQLLLLIAAHHFQDHFLADAGLANRVAELLRTGHDLVINLRDHISVT